MYLEIYVWSMKIGSYMFIFICFVLRLVFRVFVDLMFGVSGGSCGGLEDRVG